MVALTVNFFESGLFCLGENLFGVRNQAMPFSVWSNEFLFGQPKSKQEGKNNCSFLMKIDDQFDRTKCIRSVSLETIGFFGDYRKKRWRL